MQLDLLTSENNNVLCLEQLRKHSQEQKGWVVIFSDKKINKAEMHSLQVNPKLIWQLNSSLITNSTLQRLNKHISCVIVTASVATHPLIKQLQHTCSEQNIDFMQEVTAIKQPKLAYQRSNNKEDSLGCIQPLHTLKEELTELLNSLSMTVNV